MYLLKALCQRTRSRVNVPSIQVDGKTYWQFSGKELSAGNSLIKQEIAFQIHMGRLMAKGIVDVVKQGNYRYARITEEYREMSDACPESIASV
ncbi:hypothetical protein [Vibrio panuliri]|uniref:hypothetical protein n=1 Tax=Vibrio panuliri TaxID=1381081 RepID=UPI0011153678|nr:hypothetical protein [Vibrio panuliri]KAB1457755.1 hypothetical protein F7O85_08450 [Vibrio panuliri]